jgi:hypothetical protein
MTNQFAYKYVVISHKKRVREIKKKIKYKKAKKIFLHIFLSKYLIYKTLAHIYT